MSKLTAELIADSPQFMNSVNDWELSLRGMMGGALNHVISA